MAFLERQITNLQARAAAEKWSEALLAERIGTLTQVVQSREKAAAQAFPGLVPRQVSLVAPPALGPGAPVSELADPYRSLAQALGGPVTETLTPTGARRALQFAYGERSLSLKLAFGQAGEGALSREYMASAEGKTAFLRQLYAKDPVTGRLRQMPYNEVLQTKLRELLTPSASSSVGMTTDFAGRQVHANLGNPASVANAVRRLQKSGQALLMPTGMDIRLGKAGLGTMSEQIRSRAVLMPPEFWAATSITGQQASMQELIQRSLMTRTWQFQTPQGGYPPVNPQQMLTEFVEETQRRITAAGLQGELTPAGLNPEYLYKGYLTRGAPAQTLLPFAPFSQATRRADQDLSTRAVDAGRLRTLEKLQRVRGVAPSLVPRVGIGYATTPEFQALGKAFEKSYIFPRVGYVLGAEGQFLADLSEGGAIISRSLADVLGVDVGQGILIGGHKANISNVIRASIKDPLTGQPIDILSGIKTGRPQQFAEAAFNLLVEQGEIRRGKRGAREVIRAFGLPTATERGRPMALVERPEQILEAFETAGPERFQLRRAPAIAQALGVTEEELAGLIRPRRATVMLPSGTAMTLDVLAAPTRFAVRPERTEAYRPVPYRPERGYLGMYGRGQRLSVLDITNLKIAGHTEMADILAGYMRQSGTGVKYQNIAAFFAPLDAGGRGALPPGAPGDIATFGAEGLRLGQERIPMPRVQEALRGIAALPAQGADIALMGVQAQYPDVWRILEQQGMRIQTPVPLAMAGAGKVVGTQQLWMPALGGIQTPYEGKQVGLYKQWSKFLLNLSQLPAEVKPSHTATLNAQLARLTEDMTSRAFGKKGLLAQAAKVRVRGAAYSVIQTYATTPAEPALQAMAAQRLFGTIRPEVAEAKVFAGAFTPEELTRIGGEAKTIRQQIKAQARIYGTDPTAALRRAMGLKGMSERGAAALEQMIGGWGAAPEEGMAFVSKKWAQRMGIEDLIKKQGYAYGLGTAYPAIGAESTTALKFVVDPRMRGVNVVRTSSALRRMVHRDIDLDKMSFLIRADEQFQQASMKMYGDRLTAEEARDFHARGVRTTKRAIADQNLKTSLLIAQKWGRPSEEPLTDLLREITERRGPITSQQIGEALHTKIMTPLINPKVQSRRRMLAAAMASGTLEGAGVKGFQLRALESLMSIAEQSAIQKAHVTTSLFKEMGQLTVKAKIGEKGFAEKFKHIPDIEKIQQLFTQGHIHEAMRGLSEDTFKELARAQAFTFRAPTAVAENLWDLYKLGVQESGAPMMIEEKGIIPAIRYVDPKQAYGNTLFENDLHFKQMRKSVKEITEHVAPTFEAFRAHLQSQDAFKDYEDFNRLFQWAGTQEAKREVLGKLQQALPAPGTTGGAYGPMMEELWKPHRAIFGDVTSFEDIKTTNVSTDDIGRLAAMIKDERLIDYYNRIREEEAFGAGKVESTLKSKLNAFLPDKATGRALKIGALVAGGALAATAIYNTFVQGKIDAETPVPADLSEASRRAPQAPRMPAAGMSSPTAMRTRIGPANVRQRGPMGQLRHDVRLTGIGSEIDVAALQSNLSAVAGLPTQAVLMDHRSSLSDRTIRRRIQQSDQSLYP